LAAVVLDSRKVLEREQVAREAAVGVLDLCASRLALAYGAVEGRELKDGVNAVVWVMALAFHCLLQ
jgi:hypothetical protein